MKRTISLFFVAAAILALPACESGATKTTPTPTQPVPPPGSNNPQDLAAVTAAWANYERALETKDGAAVNAFLTEGSYSLYANLLRIALDGSRTEVEALPAPAMWEVLTMRQRCTRSQLVGLDARQYVAFATSQGWYQGNDPTPLEKITSGNNTAVATVKHPSESKTYQFVFRRVNGVWLFDEPSCHAYYADLFDAEARSQGIPVRQLVLDMVKESSGQPLKVDIWDPMS